MIPKGGVDLLDAMGAIQEVPRFDRPGLVADAVKGKKDALVVAATHDEIDRINQAIHLAGESEGQRESRTFTRKTAGHQLASRSIRAAEMSSGAPGGSHEERAAGYSLRRTSAHTDLAPGPIEYSNRIAPVRENW
jgi:hypothetical protein